MEINEHPLLRLLTPEQSEAFANLTEIESYEPGQDMVHEGEPGDSMFMILSGEADVLKRSEIKSGQRRDVRLAALGPGEFFGEMSLVSPVPRSATVRAVAPTRVIRFSTAALKRSMTDDPRLMNSILLGIIRGMSERLRITSEIVVSLRRSLDQTKITPVI